MPLIKEIDLMENVAICQLCGSRIHVLQDKFFILGQHLIEKHPDIQITHFQFDMKNIKKGKSMCKSRKNRKYLKTTVESWHPGGPPLFCPLCNSCGQPLIRRQKNKVAASQFGSFLLMHCWPLCFLPLVMCGKDNIIVCCRNCGYVFGNYDQRKKHITPLSEPKQVDLP